MNFEDEKANMEKIRLCQEIVDEIQAQSRRPESAGNFKVSWGKKAMYEKRAVFDCNNQNGLVVLV